MLKRKTNKFFGVCILGILMFEISHLFPIKEQVLDETSDDILFLEDII